MSEDKDTLCDKLQTCLVPRHLLLGSYQWISDSLMAKETSYKREGAVHSGTGIPIVQEAALANQAIAMVLCVLK
jgi:hypothetical protein